MCSTGVLLFVLLFGYCQIVDPACTYPSELQNAQWTSSWTDTTTNTYSTLTFTTSNLTIDFYDAIVSTYSCFLTDGGNKYLLRSSLFKAFDINFYRYLCFEFRRQNSYSYGFYVLSNSYGSSTYYQNIAETISASIDNVCNNTKTDGEYYVLIRKMTCVPVTAQSSTSGQTSVGLIVGVVVGVVIVLAIVCGVLWYKLYWVKKKKASITKITENRREKFQDLYLEEKDQKSTITREDVIFSIEDEDHITPSSPTITTEGDTQHSTTKVANGHAVTQSNDLVPNNGNTMEGPASLSPYMEDPAPMDDLSSVNRRPEKFKSLDLDEESSSHLQTINEVEDEEMPSVTMTTKTTNLFVADLSAPESLTLFRERFKLVYQITLS